MSSTETTQPDPFADKLAALPPRPGVYLFRDKKGDALYIGKAKSLRSRVRSYFQEGGNDTRGFIPLLRRHASDVETIVTGTEKEAAILENSLIKENRPRYNVKLRDDKEYLTLRLDERHEWPKLDLVRRPDADGARYFGPYHSATAARRTLHLVEKHFQLRTCSDRDLVSRKRPCLQFQIKRCLAPCVHEVSRELYAQQLRAVSLFLDGRHDELTRELQARMRDASRSMEFELAALYRDQLAAVESVRQAQRVVSVTDRDRDVAGFYREGDLVELAVLYVRAGRVVDATTFSMPRVELPDDEVVAAFVRDHYAEDGPGGAVIPDDVIVPVLPEGAAGVEEWLAERRGKKVELIAPSRGHKKKLLELAMDNARHAFEEKRRSAEDVEERLARLQQRLRLPTLPRRLECIDISHLGGGDTVGAVVSFCNGVPDKKRYKTFNVKNVRDGDDYGAMYEVLGRRFARSKPDAESERTGDGWELPDLLVVDGGRGQLAVALTAAHDLGLHDLPVVGLAKERESPLGEKLVDRVYLPGQKNPIPLRPNSPELFLLSRARDEAHRFANRGRNRLGKRRRIGSELDQVRGIGPKTRKALLVALGSVAALRDASDEQILAVPGVTQQKLRALREHFAGPSRA
jgi:excinuclease ABC subunit C